MSQPAAASNPSGKIPPWVRRAILLWWGILVGLWVALTAVRALQGLLTQVVLALFFSFAMEPLVDKLSERGVKRGIATGVTMFAILVFFAGFLTAMGSLIANQLRLLASDLPAYIESADLWIEDRFGVQLDTQDVITQLQAGGQASQYLSGLADNLVGVGTSLLSVMFQTLTISLFAYYFTADGPRLRRAICSVLPQAQQHEVLRVWELAINKTGAFISSRIILAIISATFHWLVFALLDLPSSLALAIWVGLISQFIPVIGIYIAGVIPVLIALGIDPLQALWVIAAIVVYQQIENFLLQPRVTAQTLNMHPAVAFAAVLAGTATFGASGAVLALPVLATVQSFISVYIARHTVIDSRLLGAIAGRAPNPDPTATANTPPDPPQSDNPSADTATDPTDPSNSRADSAPTNSADKAGSDTTDDVDARASDAPGDSDNDPDSVEDVSGDTLELANGQLGNGAGEGDWPTEAEQQPS